MNLFPNHSQGRVPFTLIICGTILFFCGNLLKSAELVSWGLGEIVTPASLPDVVSVAVASDHAVALNRDGTVAGWPDGRYVPADLTNAVAVAAGWAALRDSGSITTWGSLHLLATAPSRNIVDIAGNYTGVALLANGQVASAWGGPLALSSLTDAVQVSAGYGFALVLRSDTSVAVINGPGASLPVRDDLSNIVAVAAGASHALALTADGRVLAWDALGQSDVTNVPTGLSNVVAIAAGNEHSLALKADGTVVEWGSSAAIPQNLTRVVAISTATGGDYNVALIDTGAPFITSQPVNTLTYKGQKILLRASATGTFPLSYQWRHNGTNVPSATNSFLLLEKPQLADAGSYALSISNSLGVTTSRKATLSVIDGMPTLPVPMTNQVVYTGERITFGPVKVFASEPFGYQWQHNGAVISGQTTSALVIDHALARDSGQYAVIVTNAFGAITQSVTLTVSTVIEWPGEHYPPLDTRDIVSTTAGWYTRYALRRNGTVMAWDNNGNSVNLKDGFTNIQAIAADAYYLYALKEDGTIITDRPLPPGPGLSNVVSIASSDFCTFAVLADGTAVGWGSFVFPGSLVPVTVPPGVSNIVSIAAGYEHALALKTDGTVIAWGNNSSGQTSVPTGLSDIVDISAGDGQSLALRRDGTTVAWGFGLSPSASAFTNVAVLVKGSATQAILRDGTIVGSQDTPPGLTNVVDEFAQNNYGNINLVVSGDVAPFLTTRPLGSTIGAGNALTLWTEAIGSFPLTYQWRRGGVDLPGATSKVLTLTNAQPGDTGDYMVVVSNAFGVTPSGIASVVVTNTRPSIALSITNQTVSLGDTVLFSATAKGSTPLSYQWQFNGSDISLATNPVLKLDLVSALNNGTYQVVVSNSVGVVTSSVAALTVIVPLGQALDTSGLAWSSSGNAPWHGQLWTSHDGSDAAQSGRISDGQQSVLQTTYGGPATVSFWWKVSSEPFWDTLSFSVGGMVYTNISGEVDWQQQTFTIPAGMQTLAWIYSKDPGTSNGQDAGWVDQISILGGTAPPLLAKPVLKNDSFSLSVVTDPGKTYTLEFKNNLTEPVWKPIITASGDGATQSLSDTNIPGALRFYRVRETY